jgi:diaminopropionate ammonia-lyase
MAMFLPNQHPDYRKPLDPVDAEMLGVKAAEEVERYLTFRDNHAPTNLHALPALAAELGVGAIHVKDEGSRLGLGSFKALGGSYAVIQLVLEEASRQLGRLVEVAELHSPEVRAVASGMTVTCATERP